MTGGQRKIRDSGRKNHYPVSSQKERDKIPESEKAQTMSGKSRNRTDNQPLKI
jgi:hypothetical protein